MLQLYSFYRTATSASNSDITMARGMAMIRAAPPTVVSHTGAMHPEGNSRLLKLIPINSVNINRPSKQHDICTRGISYKPYKNIFPRQ